MHKAFDIAWRLLWTKTFRFWERVGIHITPVHYLSPVPDTRALPDQLWLQNSELIGVSLKEEEQLALLGEFVSRYKPEYDEFPESPNHLPHRFYLRNPSFGAVDAEILFCMIRHFKPRRIIEIGSGFSTRVHAQALLQNQELDGTKCTLSAIEPFPRPPVEGGFPGLAELIRQPVQKVDVEYFCTLQANDILFIDSSHVLTTGSDVAYEFLEILPRLNPGVIVHVHDIFLPAEYKREWLMRDRVFFTEQYLLQAFLAFNDAFEVMWAGSYMHLQHPDSLANAFRSYNRSESWPGSFWMRRQPTHRLNANTSTQRLDTPDVSGDLRSI